jgi:hypothetical protein
MARARSERSCAAEPGISSASSRSAHAGRGEPFFADQLASEPEADLFERLRAAESIGRPLGGNRFLARAERLTGRLLKPGKRGPTPPERDDD